MILEHGFQYFLDPTLLGEKLGYTAVFISDHFMMPENTTTVDPWTTLCALGARTKRIRLGSLVTPIPFYQPHVLAKNVVVVDMISQGRALLGAGCGWYEKEFRAYHIPFHSFRERFEQTLEGLQLMKKLWTVDGPVMFQGRFYQLENAEFMPKPHQKPYPPIWFGGSSTRILKAIANLGDGWIPYELPPKIFEKKIRMLKNFVKDAGRRFEDLIIAISARTIIADTEEKVNQAMKALSMKREAINPSTGQPMRCICGTPEEIITQIQEYADLGVSHICIGVQPLDQMNGSLSLFWEKVASKLV
jgi:alkanesulfonate monooxygenase SsuD/methylene tetrahydromethanopterin reductase-like flavin-dependent oxidoreductase (luciferase family)